MNLFPCFWSQPWQTSFPSNNGKIFLPVPEPVKSPVKVKIPVEGMCIGECNITMENLDLESKNIRLERSKGSISNWQLLVDDEIKAIKSWLRKKPKSKSNYLFISRKGTPVSRSQFFRLFNVRSANMFSHYISRELLKPGIIPPL